MGTSLVYFFFMPDLGFSCLPVMAEPQLSFGNQDSVLQSLLSLFLPSIGSWQATLPHSSGSKLTAPQSIASSLCPSLHILDALVNSPAGKWHNLVHVQKNSLESFSSGNDKNPNKTGLYFLLSCSWQNRSLGLCQDMGEAARSWASREKRHLAWVRRVTRYNLWSWRLSPPPAHLSFGIMGKWNDSRFHSVHFHVELYVTDSTYW